ncbi:MAG: class I SAM-dependent methyltransferase [Propionibacteriaceae bacterium]|nr:class I SAM-dependent methyltransferase [Propionibacteriaceae bacterium]
MTEPIQEWYGDIYDENTRLTAYALEFVRSKDIISRYLDATPMQIADVGGATGPYSFWLAGLGHSLHLVDLVSRHVEEARARADRDGTPLASYHCGDARSLPFDDGEMELVLEMGPLYHLQQRDARIAALQEAWRALKPGGVVICSAISRYASLLDGFAHEFVKDGYFRAIMDEDLATGCHENPQKRPDYFTTAFFHRPDDLRDELVEAGFTYVKVLAVEGFAAWLDADRILEDDATMGLLLDYLRLTEQVPELLGISAHLMGVGAKVEIP